MNVQPFALLLWFPILLPAAAGLACRLMPSGKWIFRTVLAVAVADAAIAAVLVWGTASGGRLFAASGWLFLDALSAFHLAVMSAVALFASVYSRSYFRSRNPCTASTGAGPGNSAACGAARSPRSAWSCSRTTSASCGSASRPPLCSRPF